MFADVLNVGRETVDRIRLVVDHTDAAVGLVQRVSTDDIVAVVLLPGALVVARVMVLHSVFVGVGDFLLVEVRSR